MRGLHRLEIALAIGLPPRPAGAARMALAHDDEPRPRQHVLALPHRRHAGPGRPGDRLQGRGPAAQPHRRDQGPEAGARLERDRAAALRARGGPVLRPRQPAHPGRLRHRGDGRPLLHRAAVRGGADPQAVHGRPAARDALRALDRDPARRRPRGGPRERDRPPRPQARQHHRRARRPGEDPRLRPRQDARAGRRGGRQRDAVEDRRSPDRDRRALRLDGLQLAGAGLGPGRRPPHRRVQPRRRAVRDGHRRRPVPRPPRGRGAERGHQRRPRARSPTSTPGPSPPSSRSSTGRWRRPRATAIRRWPPSATS